jgi:hypothetical protein
VKLLSCASMHNLLHLDDQLQTQLKRASMTRACTVRR